MGDETMKDGGEQMCEIMYLMKFVVCTNFNLRFLWYSLCRM
jgi:hypothetical protein